MNKLSDGFRNPSSSAIKMFPEVFALKGVLQPEKWHPEGDAFEHTMMVLDSGEIALDDKVWYVKAENQVLYWGLLCHDLGKALIPREKWPKHHGHAFYGIEPTKQLLKRVGFGEYIIDRVCFLVKYHMHIHDAFKLNPKTYIKMVEEAGQITQWSKDPLISANHLFRDLSILGVCDNMGRGNFDPNVVYHNPDLMYQVLNLISLNWFDQRGLINNATSIVTRMKECYSNGN